MKLYLLFIAIFISSMVNAQTATSVMNGNYTNPLTWNCTCVPTPGYSVVVNHTVTLNTSMSFPSGSLTINSTGKLLQDATGRDILLNGGSILNSGKFTLRYLYVQSGTVTNNDTIRVKSFADYGTLTNNKAILDIDSFYVDGTFTNNGYVSVHTFYNNNITHNYGTIAGTDSSTNAGTFVNHSNAIIYSDSLLNTGTYTNDGTVNNGDFFNLGNYTNNNRHYINNLTNAGNYYNNDSIISAIDLSNAGYLYNPGGSTINVTRNMLNGDSLYYDAVLNNNGHIWVGNDWLNADTTKGTTGQIIIQNLSGNIGYLKESFDLCDLTPPVNSPYIDYNIGYISPLITWCQTTLVNSPEKANILIYPNPVKDKLLISNVEYSKVQINIYAATGELVKQGSGTNSIGLDGLDNGIYLLQISDKNSKIIYSQKFIKAE